MNLKLFEAVGWGGGGGQVFPFVLFLFFFLLLCIFVFGRVKRRCWPPGGVVGGLASPLPCPPVGGPGAPQCRCLDRQLWRHL